jgi:hypothetical protein
MAEAARSRWALAVALCSIAAMGFAADELESLDADFLAYLAEYEGDEDDWTAVAAIAARTAKPAPAAKAPSAPPTASAPKPAKPAAAPDNGSQR